MVLTFGLGAVLTTLLQQVLVLWLGEHFWCRYSWDLNKVTAADAGVVAW